MHGRDGDVVGEARRFRVEAAQGAEILAVGAEDRDREIALEAVDARRMVLAVLLGVAHAVDDDRTLRVAQVFAQGRGHVQPGARLQAEVEPVEHCAGDPRIVGDVRDADET